MMGSQHCLLLPMILMGNGINQDILIGEDPYWPYCRNTRTLLSVSGVGDRSSFLLSASHQEQGTVYPGNSGYKTNALNSNYNYNSTDRRFSLTASNYLTFQSNNVINSDFTRLSLSLAPNAPALYDTNGNINWQENTFSNPMAALNGTYEAKTFRLNQDISAGYAISDNFKLKLNGGFNYWSLQETTLSPNTMYNPAFPAGQVQLILPQRSIIPTLFLTCWNLNLRGVKA